MSLFSWIKSLFSGQEAVHRPIAPKLQPAAAPPATSPVPEKRPNGPYGIVWNSEAGSPEKATIRYADRNGEYSEREVLILCRGRNDKHSYLGVKEGGKFKTLRADRVLEYMQG